MAGLREVMGLPFIGGDLRKQFVSRIKDSDRECLLAVAVDVGKHSAAAMVVDFWGEVLVERFDFEMNEGGFEQFRSAVATASAVRDAVLVRVGLERAGHYHQPLLARLEQAGMETVLLNPAQVKANRAQDLLRSLKSDARDLGAIADLVVRGKGRPAEPAEGPLAAQAAWVAHRRRRVKGRTALKNQLLGTLDLVFPGLDGCFDSILDTKVGKVLIAEGLDPQRVSRLGAERLRAFCDKRGVMLQRRKADQIVSAAKAAFTLPVARQRVHAAVLACDVTMLAALDAQIAEAEQRLAEILPHTPARILTTIPMVGVVRASAYGAAVGDHRRFASASQVYRLSGLVPRMYESAGRHRTGASISREGKVELREAILELGKALRFGHPDFKRYAAELKNRGKPAGVVACALGNRANRLAFAMLRDQRPFDPARWG